MDKLRFNTLRMVVKFFRHVASFADENKMNAENLSVTVGPNLMHVKAEDIGSL